MRTRATTHTLIQRRGHRSSITMLVFFAVIAWLLCSLIAAGQQNPIQPFDFGLSNGTASDTPSPMSPIVPKRHQGPVALENFLLPLDDAGQDTRSSSDQHHGDESPFRSSSFSRRNQDDVEEVDLGESVGRRVPLSNQTETIYQRYPDGKVQIERLVAQDADGNFYNHGPWKLLSPSGQTIAEGVFQLGLMEGTWQRWYAGGEDTIFALRPFSMFRAPFLSHGTFRNGKLHGVWVIHDQQQRKVMDITYRDGQRHGTATWWYPNGTKMREVAFHQGLLDGPLREFDERGEVTRTEDYVRGRKVVIETANYPSGKKFVEAAFLEPLLELERDDNWWDARPAEFRQRGVREQHGPVNVWYENGQPLMQGQFVEGERQGTFTWFHANGQRQLVGSYHRGEQVGTWTWWHENGLKATQGAYEREHPVGPWTWWSTEGQVVDRQTFNIETNPQRLMSPTKEETLPAPEKKVPVIDLEELEGLDRDLKIEGSLPPNPKSA